MKYQVTLETIASAYITVEADSEDEAIEAAFEEAPDICAQCSGWNRGYELELAEWDTPRGEDGGDADYTVEAVES